MNTSLESPESFLSEMEPGMSYARASAVTVAKFATKIDDGKSNRLALRP